MPARTRKIRHDSETRAKIQASQIINRLHKHVMGEVELDAAQVSSAKTLLNKVLPDLKAVELTGQNGGPLEFANASDLTDEQLAAIAAGSSTGTS